MNPADLLPIRPLRSQTEDSGSLPHPDASTALLEQLLVEQQELTAVEEFARFHEKEQGHSQAKYYQKLMPAGPPGEGQQYGFEVDLDRCSGCKACVAACHGLNGLDEHETWRDVGLLLGGTRSNPVMQHVTTACHHCLEPACMTACPVDAYVKDPITGIVKHLDDQCFGCQYCTLACPYDVPKYHAGKGIVRKCDMCSDRLVAGEAPACVQACPHEAISIRVVSVIEVRENAEADQFLPAAPESHLTYPTTSFKTRRPFPRNMLPADYYSENPQHPHWPLIIMLVLTQLSVGTFTVGMLLEKLVDPVQLALIRPLQSTLALGLGLLALGASTFHLGRPQYAYRAIIGLKHSWLSREIVAFGLFAVVAAAYASASGGREPPDSPIIADAIDRSETTTASGSPSVSSLGESGGSRPPLADAEEGGILLEALGWAVVVTGGLGLFCSIMIYVFTQRDFWSFGSTATKFLLTALNLGLATTFLVFFLFAFSDEAGAASTLFRAIGPTLARFLIVGSTLKLIVELTVLKHLLSYRNSPLKRSARLLIGPLGNSMMARVAVGLLGGVFMPLFLLSKSESLALGEIPSLIMVLFLFGACLAGELLERYQFFAAVAAPRMPGGPRR